MGLQRVCGSFFPAGAKASYRSRPVQSNLVSQGSTAIAFNN
ncbi:hypothetical protein ALTERO38_60621 [Alteromonas sp. 38]|nr:hypothetical protein ALTER154_40174 [Alteromonas sp. 154]VXC27944.1 hypothetical protein ALTERO38_60621 [Alteromonas sp. 38]